MCWIFKKQIYIGSCWHCLVLVIQILIVLYLISAVHGRELTLEKKNLRSHLQKKREANMDFAPSKEREIVIDIEGFVDASREVVGTPSPADENSGNVVSVTVSSTVDENSSNPKSADDISRKNSKRENGKPMSKKKPSKPPRPPRGLSLDAFDQKLIKEISELAMLKRAKIERMKALKKMKASSSSTSSSGNLMAILFTVIFCLVIILQGKFHHWKKKKKSGTTYSSQELRFLEYLLIIIRSCCLHRLPFFGHE